MSSFIFKDLPFYVKGNILDFIGNYKFRKGLNGEAFINQINKESIILFEKNFIKIPKIIVQPIINNNKEKYWNIYCEFKNEFNQLIWTFNKNYNIENGEEVELLNTIKYLIIFPNTN